MSVTPISRIKHSRERVFLSVFQYKNAYLKYVLYLLWLYFLCIPLFLVSLNASAAPLLSTSPKASALGNAVTADPIGLSSAAFNPAGLTKIKTGKEGGFREYKVLFAPFPDYEISSTKPPPDNDPYNHRTQGVLFVNDQENAELFQGEDPRDTAWEPEIEKLMIYIPGFDEIIIDDSALEYILLPFMTTAYRANPNSPFTFTTTILPGGGGAIFKQEEWMIRENFAAFGILGFAPSLAYKVNDKLSIGATLTLQRAGAKAGLDSRSIAVMLPAINSVFGSLCGDQGNTGSAVCNAEYVGLDYRSSAFHLYFEAEDSFNVTYDIGVLWEPTHWLAFGLAFDPGTEFRMSGAGGADLSPQIAQFFNDFNEDTNGAVNAIFGGQVVENYTGKVSIKMPISRKVSVGVSMKLTPRLKVNMDYHWRNSSVFNEFALSIDDADQASARGIVSVLFPLFTHRVDLSDFPKSVVVGESDLGFKFKDVGSVALGVSYKVSHRWTVRGGFEERGSALTGDLPLGIPTDSLRTIGMGISYLWNKDSTLDVTYVNLNMEGEARADESLMTSINPYWGTIALWSGTDLFTSVNAKMLQIGYSTSF